MSRDLDEAFDGGENKRVTSSNKREADCKRESAGVQLLLLAQVSESNIGSRRIMHSENRNKSEKVKINGTSWGCEIYCSQKERVPEF